MPVSAPRSPRRAAARIGLVLGAALLFATVVTTVLTTLLAPVASAAPAAPVVVGWNGSFAVTGGTALGANAGIASYAAPAGNVALTNGAVRSVVITIAGSGAPPATYRIVPGTVFTVVLPAGTYTVTGVGERPPTPVSQLELQLGAAGHAPAPATVAPVLAPPKPTTNRVDPLLAALAPAQYALDPEDSAAGSPDEARAAPAPHAVSGLGRSVGLAAALAAVALVGAASAYFRVVPALGGAAFVGIPTIRAPRRARPSRATPARRTRPAAHPQVPALPPSAAPQGCHVELITTVGGRPLGRHVEHDPRSRAYPVPTRPDAGLAVSHVRRTPVFHQGHLASATATALLGWLGTDRADTRGSLQRAEAVPTLYALATELDAIPGAYPDSDTGSSALGVMKAAQRQGLISSYRHAFTLEQALSALAVGPVLAGTRWYADMDHPEFDGRIQIGGPLRGGHEYLVVGYDPLSGLVECCNSWGRAWGHRGRFFLTLEDWQTLLAQDGDVTVPVV